MKKIIVIVLLCGFMVLGITGCNENKKDTDSKEEYTIIDKMNEQRDLACDDVLQEFYIDDNYSYYWDCGKDNYVVVRYTNGNEEKVSDALKNKTISIEDLDRFNIKYSKKGINKNIDVINGKSCEYVKTYKFLDYYNYDATVPSNFFIVVDQFQDNSPMIIELNSNFKNINFVKNENYEFTFKDVYSSISKTDGYAISKKSSVSKVEHTDKVGMEQVQESCILK